MNDKFLWAIAIAQIVVLGVVFLAPWDYYMINFTSRNFPEIRCQMPCFVGETARHIWDDVYTWDEYRKSK